MQQTAIRVNEIAFTSYPAIDMARARKFYETVLGLQPDNVSSNGVYVEYSVGSGSFALMCIESWKPSLSGPAIAFEVDDLENTLQVLRKENVTILDDSIESPVCRMAVIEDSEGNKVIIHKLKS